MLELPSSSIFFQGICIIFLERLQPSNIRSIFRTMDSIKLKWWHTLYFDATIVLYVIPWWLFRHWIWILFTAGKYSSQLNYTEVHLCSPHNSICHFTNDVCTIVYLLSHDHFKFFYDKLYSTFYIFLFICLSGFQRAIPGTLTPNFHQMTWNQRSPSFVSIELPKLWRDWSIT